MFWYKYYVKEFNLLFRLTVLSFWLNFFTVIRGDGREFSNIIKGW